MGSRIKLLILYIATSAVIYGSFWIGYCINFVIALVLAILLVLALAVLFAILRHKTWPAILCAMGLSLAIGLSLSAIFTGLKLPASRFLGLTLLIMVGYKGLQLFITYIIHNRILKNIINSLFVIAEIISIILVMTSKLDVSVRYQLLSTGLVGIFYSLGIFTLFNSGESSFWRTAAICYFIGFALIFIIAVLIIISALCEDGSPFESLGEFIGEGFFAGDVPSSTGRKKHNPINPH